MASELPSLLWRLTVKEAKASAKGRTHAQAQPVASQWLDF